MKHAMSTAIRSALAALILTMALPFVASAQQRAVSRDSSSSSDGGSQAVPRGQAPAPAAPRAAAPSPQPSTTGGRASSGDSSSPRSVAVPRSTGRSVPTPGSPATPASPASTFSSQSGGARPREGRPPVGTAVPRGSVAGPQPPIYVQPVYRYPYYPYYGGYWPWGFGGIGFGSYYGAYFGGFWGPYYPWYGGYPSFGYGYYGGYYGYPSSYTYGFEGSVRLKVKPRNAQVFVDGYYVGVVDEFDGVLQRLHLESGPHRLEVRAEGYETMTFDVRVRFDDTTTLEGQLKPIR